MVNNVKGLEAVTGGHHLIGRHVIRCSVGTDIALLWRCDYCILHIIRSQEFTNESNDPKLFTLSVDIKLKSYGAEELLVVLRAVLLESDRDWILNRILLSGCAITVKAGLGMRLEGALGDALDFVVWLVVTEQLVEGLGVSAGNSAISSGESDPLTVLFDDIDDVCDCCWFCNGFNGEVRTSVVSLGTTRLELNEVATR